MEQTKYDVYISYSRKDTLIANKIADVFIQDGIYGFLLYTDISTFNMNDASVWDTIGKGIDNGGTITPDIKIGKKPVKDFFEEIQRRITH